MVSSTQTRIGGKSSVRNYLDEVVSWVHLGGIFLMDLMEVGISTPNVNCEAPSES